MKKQEIKKAYEQKREAQRKAMTEDFELRLKQFSELKVKHPDAVLLFRVGDFYEAYAEDAKACTDALPHLTLTKRKKSDGREISLTGFPHYSLDMYLPKIVRFGKRVAICEQLENPN